jgi:hypothetical protein
MSETPVPETLETIAAKIDALAKSNDQRFATVDQQLADTRAHLGVKIEALDTKVVQVYDEVIAMRADSRRNATEHHTFTTRLDSHDLRILALEKPGPHTT